MCVTRSFYPVVQFSSGYSPVVYGSTRVFGTLSLGSDPGGELLGSRRPAWSATSAFYINNNRKVVYSDCTKSIHGLQTWMVCLFTNNVHCRAADFIKDIARDNDRKFLVLTIIPCILLVTCLHV